MNDSSKYLQEGKQTKITDLVRQHAQKAESTETNQGKNSHPNLHKTFKVCKYMYQLSNIDGYIQRPANKQETHKNYKLKDSIFRKRTLHEVLEQGLYPTCSDEGLVFRGLMIALGVPAAYVETFHEDYLLGKKFQGHVIGRIQAGEKWYYIDPKNNDKRVIETEEDLFPLIVYKEGLDSWDIGIRGYEDMHIAKRDNVVELMEKYKKMLAHDCEQKKMFVDEIIKNPSLVDLRNDLDNI